MSKPEMTPAVSASSMKAADRLVRVPPIWLLKCNMIAIKKALHADNFVSFVLLILRGSQLLNRDVLRFHAIAMHADGRLHIICKPSYVVMPLVQLPTKSSHVVLEGKSAMQVNQKIAM